MEETDMLERLVGAIERVLKGVEPVARTEQMTREGLLAHAIAELEKAAQEPADKAVRRLRALGKAVEIAKQAFVDHESEEVKVEVFEEETTASEEESEVERSPVAAEAGLGDSAIAANPEDLHKALARLGKELEALRGAAPKEEAGSGERVSKAADAAWPHDMNTEEFRKGVRKDESAPEWGYDPAGLRSQEG